MRKLVISLIGVFCFWILLLPPAAAAYIMDNGYCGGEGDGTNLSWTLDVDGVLTISGTGAMAEASYDWRTYSSFITQVYIEDGVTTIGKNAFLSCVSLTDVFVGNDVTSIGTYAFGQCTALAHITLGSNVSTIETMAFMGCSSLDSIQIPDSVTTIGKNAFYNCGRLTSVTIGDGVTEIAENTFANCTALSYVELGDHVTTIGDSAFFGCSALSDVQFGARVSVISAQAFVRCNGLRSVVIPDSVRELGRSAFSSCEGLTDITIGSGVVTIGESAFGSCTNLTHVVIGERVETIGANAFSGCEALQSITIPDSVTTLGKSAFSYCSALTRAVIGNRVSDIGEYAFYECGSLSEVTLGGNVAGIGDQAFYGCGSLKRIVIPDSVTRIGQMAFQNCGKLESVTFGEQVTTIGSQCFCQCSALKEVVIPDSVTTIEGYAFCNCTNLTSVVMGSGVTSMESIFHECGTIHKIVFKGNCTDLSLDLGYVIVKNAFFYGDAPKNISRSFCYEKIFYLRGTQGWTYPTWNGIPTQPVIRSEYMDQLYAKEYYEKSTKYKFTFRTNKGSSLDNVTLTYKNTSICSEESSSLYASFTDMDPDDVFVISREGYRSVEFPVKYVVSYNYVTLYPETLEEPILQIALASKEDGEKYTNILRSSITLNAGNLVEKTSFYFDVDWGTAGEGRIYLSQTNRPEDGIGIREGFNTAQNISARLQSGSNLYLLMETADGEVYAKKLSVYIRPADSNIELELGTGVKAPTPDLEFFQQFEFGMQLLDSTKITLTVKSDGTVKGVLGLEVKKEEYINQTVETIQDALAAASFNEYEKGYRSLAGAISSLQKGGLCYIEAPKSSKLIISGELQTIGYLEGKLVKRSDGSDDLLVTECGLGFLFEGEAGKKWQSYAFGAPFYLGAGIEAEVQFTTAMYADKNLTKLTPGDSKMTGEGSIKASAGLGWDSILSAGIYGKGTLHLEQKFPTTNATRDRDHKLYANATFGAEANFFCFEMDWEIINTKDYYLIGSPDAISPRMGLPDWNDTDWQPQSRDYLYAVTPLAIEDSNTESSGEIIVNHAYTYANVQLAALADGSQLMVWTADPGTREEANNRTVLYYSYYHNGQWSAPLPVEAEDDGTGDFNPVLQVLNGNVYLLWQDAARPLLSTDTISDTSALMDISCAVFQPESAGFTLLGSVGTEYYDGAVSATMLNGDLAIVWTSNSASLPLSDGQNTTLHRAVWNGSAWVSEVLAEALGSIDQTAADGSCVWFSADTDYDSATFADREIFLWDGVLQRLTNNTVADTKPVCMNGTAIWYSDGAIVNGSEMISLAEDTDRYQYLCSETGLEAIVYVVTQTETRLSSLYASFQDGTGWGAPIRLDGGCGNIGDFSAQFQPDGTLSILVRERMVSETRNGYEVPELQIGSQLKLYTVVPSCDLTLTDVQYDAHTLIADGALHIQAELYNAGVSAIEFVQITVRDGDAILCDDVYSMSLLSGESDILLAAVPLPETVPEKLTVVVSAVGYSDSREENNSAELSLRLWDISLEDSDACTEGTTTEISVLVVNRGLEAFHGVTLSLKDADGNVLASRDDFAMDAGESEFVSFLLDRTFENNTLLKVEASGLENENIQANNTVDILVTVSAGEFVSLSASCLETDTALHVVIGVHNTTQNSCNYTIFSAAYDEAGRMLALHELVDQTTGTGVVNYRQITFEEDLENIAEIRVFALQEDHSPLAERVKLSVGM